MVVNRPNRGAPIPMANGFRRVPGVGNNALPFGKNQSDRRVLDAREHGNVISYYITFLHNTI